MLKNGFYNVVGAAMRVGLTLLTVPMLIYLLGVDEYGLWALVSAAVALVALAEAGLSVATTVFVSRDLAQNDLLSLAQTLTATLGATLALATLVALLLWLGAPALGLLFPALGPAERAAAIGALEVASAVVWCRLIQQMLIGVEQAFERYGWLNLMQTVQAILTTLGLVGVAWLGGRTERLMEWLAIATALVLLGHLLIVWRLIRPLRLRLRWHPPRLLAIGRYNGMTWLIQLGGTLFTQGDRLIVGALLGTPALGIYAALTSVAVQINTFSAVPVQPLLPTLGQLTSAPEPNQATIRARIKQALQLNGAVAVGLGGALCMVAPLAIRYLLPGTTPTHYTAALFFAAVVYALYSLNAVGYYALLALHATRRCMVITFGSGTLSLLLITLGAQVWGLPGAIVGNVGFLGTLLLLWSGMRRLDLPARDWLRWIWFPLLWFGLVIVIAAVVPASLLLRGPLLLLQSVLLVGWFMRQQGIDSRAVYALASYRGARQ